MNPFESCTDQTAALNTAEQETASVCFSTSCPLLQCNNSFLACCASTNQQKPIYTSPISTNKVSSLYFMQSRKLRICSFLNVLQCCETFKYITYKHTRYHKINTSRSLYELQISLLNKKTIPKEFTEARMRYSPMHRKCPICTR